MMQALAKTGDVSELEALSSKQKRLEFKRKIMEAKNQSNQSPLIFIHDNIQLMR
jgi:glutaredoxin